MAGNSQVPYRPAARLFSETELGNDDGGAQSPRRPREGDVAPDGCRRCSFMFSEQGLERLNDSAGFHHSTYTECCAAAKKGCRGCRLIVVKAEERYAEKDDREKNDGMQNNGQGGKLEDRIGSMDITFWNSSSSGDQTQKTSPPAYIDVLEGRLPSGESIITIHPYAEKDTPIAGLIRRRPLRRDVKSKRVLAAARRLYDVCRQGSGHAQCRYARNAVLPSRVLDVGTTARPSLRLLVNDAERRGEYLALSYCWGGEQRGILRRRTLDRMSGEEGIIEEGLVRSVRDAVRVTRTLGFQYLWVDAFCIIQDCQEDQRKEIGRMAMIYKNAAITIAAGTAAKAADGFLDGTGTYLPEERMVVERGRVFLRAGALEPRHTLDERGWVLQEFLLSSRILVFSEYELLWQCKEVDLRGVVGGEDGLEYLQLLESLPFVVFDEEHPESTFGNEDPEKKYLWKTIVEQYTLRQLTKPEDRLNAVKGITRELEGLWSDSEYFGLWGRWFVELMAWYRPKDSKARSTQARTFSPEDERSGRAPSWSWGSLNQMVMYTEMFLKEDATVKRVELEGRRTPRHVVLSGRILRDEDLYPGETEEDEACDSRDDNVEEFPDLKDLMTEVGDKEIEYLVLGTTQRGDSELGVGLMVVAAGNGYHKRVGLATFKDPSVWKGIAHEDIKLK